MTEHPITPPTELVEQWTAQGVNREAGTAFMTWFATQAARWGSNQELEACCEWLHSKGSPNAPRLRAARRPKPPSLKEQALEMLSQHNDGWAPSAKEWDTIRRALEALSE